MLFFTNILVLLELNSPGHKTASLYETFTPEEAKKLWDKFEFVFTPQHGMNMTEIELNVLNSQCLNRRIDNIETIKEETKAWQDHRNNKNTKINWRFTTSDSRIKLKKLYPAINT
ncbi:MAG: hypothetical protein KTR26_00450 [Flammeovirgaceae bacterium]|nr:hypothetical protein [Flammeovirgaceae bacterium]